jgi:hypothetical protein
MSSVGTPVWALIRYSRLYVAQTNDAHTVHVHPLCDDIADVETRRIVVPAQIPANAAVCDHCGGAD